MNPTAQLAGSILDSATHKPVAGASISLALASDSSKTKYTGITNGEGSYQIQGISPGNYLMYISCIGYHPVLRRTGVKVDTGPIQLPEIYLKKNTLSLLQ